MQAVELGKKVCLQKERQLEKILPTEVALAKDIKEYSVKEVTAGVNHWWLSSSCLAQETAVG